MYTVKYVANKRITPINVQAVIAGDRQVAGYSLSALIVILVI
jgi:hypothetical protein